MKKGTRKAPAKSTRKSAKSDILQKSNIRAQHPSSSRGLVKSGTRNGCQTSQDPLTEHNKTFYFYDDPMAIFLVENQLFKVHRHYLIQESEVFRDMFSIPSGGRAGVEGMSDEHPISLPGVTVNEFELLLRHFYTTPKLAALKEVKAVSSHKDAQLQVDKDLALLSIAHRFAFDKVFKLTVQRVAPAKIPIVQRIRLGDKYNLDKWLFSAYQELLDRKGSLKIDELHALGSDRVIRYIHAREFILQERLNITETVNRNQRADISQVQNFNRNSSLGTRPFGPPAITYHLDGTRSKEVAEVKTVTDITRVVQRYFRVTHSSN